MKKALLVLGLIAGSIGFSYAQKSAVTFGVKGGVNFASLTASGGGYSVNSGNITSFHIGGVADIPVGDSFSIQPGILYSGKGASGSTLGYIEVPVNLLYSTGSGSGKFFFGAGPYFGYGVSASNGNKFGSGTNDIANPDFGLNILAGYRFESGLSFSAGYGLGLANLNNDKSSGNVTVKNNVTSISVGYFFQ
ncbi:PorT family protein [Mucilaginibacter sp. HMF5004]|uniref:porin family protein n=1 Tax=Mucilaginibacter rivuli TaxID=2857527 RepID=UPI001C5F386C|nr:porin family protein [Mucilaginibacter rivuli]MBW4890546.1 PorT family protein [Mucilaginibacter rivuli]